MNGITLTSLADFPRVLEAHYAALPAGFERWVPSSWDGIPSEPLTAIEQICHLRDIEIDGYQLRFRRTLDEATPWLASIDSAALARERSYTSDNAPQALAAFRAARAQTVGMLASLTEQQLARTAVLEGYGPATLRSLAHYLCSHDQQHLAGLHWLLGQMHAA